jgi:hypothetical protein
MHDRAAAQDPASEIRGFLGNRIAEDERALRPWLAGERLLFLDGGWDALESPRRFALAHVARLGHPGLIERALEEAGTQRVYLRLDQFGTRDNALHEFDRREFAPAKKP